MEYKNVVTNFVKAWNFTRSETVEILQSLDDDKLQFQPKGEKWQSLYWQFGCMGRTQIVYTQAIITGRMDFSLFHSDQLPKKNDFQTKEQIQDFLGKANKDWREAIVSRRKEENFTVKWPGFNKPFINHIASLAEHERLHHGQLISYFTMADFQLPKIFKSNWAL